MDSPTKISIFPFRATPGLSGYPWRPAPPAPPAPLALLLRAPRSPGSAAWAAAPDVAPGKINIEKWENMEKNPWKIYENV